MKIAVVHSFYSSRQPSGENVVVRSQVEALRSAGHEVELFSRSTDAEQINSTYPIRAALNAANVPGANPSAALTSFAPDVVHVHNLFPNWSTPWLRQWRDRLVVTLHNVRPVCAAGTMWRAGSGCSLCLDRSTWSAVRLACYRDNHLATLPLAIASRNKGVHQPVLKYPRRIITLNSDAKALFEPLTQAEVVTIPNFVTVPDRASGPANHWLFVGRLAPEKGVIELIENFPSGHRLVVAGDGPLRDAVIRACDAKEHVTFLGAQTREQVLDLMRTAHALILPSLWAEGVPTVAIEALACGTPLVMSEHCKSGDELIAGGESGVLFDPISASSLMGAMEKVAASQEALRRGALRLQASEYSVEIWLTRVEEVYKSTISL